jgi:hypothetical protein
MHAEVNRALWRWGAFGLRLPNPAELNVHDDAGGGGLWCKAFDSHPNSSPS